MDETLRFKNAPWRLLSWEDLGDSRMVPTMLSPEERRAYVWLGEKVYQGKGALVELGSFAGGSTAALAEGMRRAGRTGPRIQAFDRFRVSQVPKHRFLYAAGVMPFEGEDLLPTATMFLKPWADLIDLHRVELDQEVWPGDPIELLIMDASKAVATLDTMSKTFYPALIPGGSFVVQQDFLHWKQPWVAAQMALMQDCMEPVAVCRPGTVLFRVNRPVTAQHLARAVCADLTDKALRNALDDAREMMVPFGIDGRVMLLDEAVRLNPGIRRAALMKNAPQ